jgi:hypothetical protein
MTNLTAAKIFGEKIIAGPDAYLWAHDSGDVILWASEAESIEDDGRNAIGRWKVDRETINGLSRIVDCWG